jgi:hypothetical protein
MYATCPVYLIFLNLKAQGILYLLLLLLFLFIYFLGSTAQLRPWRPPQNPAELLGGFSTIFFFTG